MNSQQPTANGQPLTANNLPATAYRSLFRGIAWFAVFVILALAGARPVWAHGGGVVQISAVAAGPYRVTVWTAPQPVRAETPLHVTVAVADEDERPVLDVAVMVELYATASGRPVISGEATTAQSTNKLFYEIDFSPPETGPHRIEVTVAGAAGEGTVDFDVDIQPPRNITWLVLGLVALAVMAAIGLFKGRRIEAPSRPRKRVSRPVKSRYREG